MSLAFLAAIGLAVVVAVSSQIFGSGDARPVTLYMSAAASVLLLLLCAASRDFAVPQTGTGWIGFGAAAVFYGFAQGVFVLILWREGGSPEGQRTHNLLPGKTCYAPQWVCRAGREANF